MVAVTAMASALRAWCQLLLTNWKKSLGAASAASSILLAWPARETRRKCSRWSADRKRSGGTILATAGPGRNLRSATEPRRTSRVPHPSRGFCERVGFLICGRNYFVVVNKEVKILTLSLQKPEGEGWGTRLYFLNVISLADLFVSCFQSANSVA